MPAKNIKKPLLARCNAAAGSVPAGNLLYRIWFWSDGGKKGFERDGKLWVTRSNPQWMFETGLTPKQLRTAFEQLIAKGIIERKHYPLENRSFIRIIIFNSPAANICTPPTCPTGHLGSAQEALIEVP